VKKKRPSPTNLSLFGEEQAVPPTRRSPRQRNPDLPQDLDPEQYELEGGLLREIVGPWVREKHAILERYVGITSSVRRNWVKRGSAGTTYIDLFSGPGRVRIKGTETVLAGSPLVAWNCSQRRGAPFTKVFVADAHERISEDCVSRLRSADAPVDHGVGAAVLTVDRAISRLNRWSYHFAFLDPFNLGALSFEVIRKLAALPHIDILIHVSAQDLNRNLRKYIAKHGSSLDAFAPGWRENVDTSRADGQVRAKIFEYWRGLLRSVGLPVAEAAELVSGEANQPLYWLAFAARNKLAHTFWDKIRSAKDDGQQSLLAT
jgi:three-Cys-motif partner protein